MILLREKKKTKKLQTALMCFSLPSHVNHLELFGWETSLCQNGLVWTYSASEQKHSLTSCYSQYLLASEMWLQVT